VGRTLVCKLEKEIDIEVDRKVLEIAALYHDIGRIKDIEDGEMDPFDGHECHAEHGSRIVDRYIEEFVSESQLEKIIEIVGNHHSWASTLEGKLVQDADKLSNFGVFNLWRQIDYAAQNEKEIQESLYYFWEDAVKQFNQHIEEMHFERTKNLAEKRLEWHKTTMSIMEKEINAEDL
jgi:HD superfamily phosphodiesterase